MKLLDRIAAVGALRRLSRLTVEAYARWVRAFLASHRLADGTWRTPAELAGPEVAVFLTHPAVDRRLGARSATRSSRRR